MSERAPGQLKCSACGSGDLRGSRPRGVREKALRLLTGARFHVCNACGKRGSHRRHGAHHGGHPLAPAPSGERAGVKGAAVRGRPLEKRDIQHARARATERTLLVLAAAALGMFLALGVHSCVNDSRPHAVQGP